MAPDSTPSCFCRRAGDRGGPSFCTGHPMGSLRRMRPTRPTAAEPGCRAPKNRSAVRSCAAGATSPGMAMSQSTRIPAAGTGRRARIASMPMMPPTASIPSNGSPIRPGPTGWWACRARPRVPRPPSLPHRRDTRACARFLLKPALPASTTTWFVRASRSRWSGCGCGWRATSRGSHARIARRSYGAPASAPRRSGTSARALAGAAASAAARYERLDAARRAEPPFVGSADWLRLPLTRYPDFATWQPFLDEIISHPAPDAFRARHNFRRTIDIPGFHVTAWFDIFQTSVLAAFNDIQARTGTQKLWVGPNEHSFVYASNFWPRDPYFEWFDHWLKREETGIMNEPPVSYSPRTWIEDRAAYVPDDWLRAERWPPPGTRTQRLYLRGDGSISAAGPGGAARSYNYDPRRPIPTLGGRNMLIDAGPRDQRPAQSLPNYGLTYRSEELPRPLTIAGNVRLTLHIQSNCTDTDFVAKLIELEPDGRAMLLMDGVTRAMYRDPSGEPRHLVPGQVERLSIDLGHIHHTFPAGHRIEVDVTSSNFPRRARNTNSGHPVLAEDGEEDIRVATNTVHHAEGTPSFLELPVLEHG